MAEIVSAVIFTTLTGIVFIFQGCLAAGMPWGIASMGGRYPGKYPPKMRVFAIINMIILSFMAIIVLSRAGLLLPGIKPISEILVWFVTAFFCLGTVLNTITPSKIERLWAPVALGQLITCIIVAIS